MKELIQEEYEMLYWLIDNRAETIKWIPNLPKDIARDETKRLLELREKLFQMSLKK